MISLVVHVAVIGLMIAQVAAPVAPASAPVLVTLVPVPPPPLPAPSDPNPAKTRAGPAHKSAAPTSAKPRAQATPPRLSPAHISPTHAARTPIPSAEPNPMQLTASDLAGAASPEELAGDGAGGGGAGGEGSGGSACDMAARVQAALRRDGLVRQALAGGVLPSTALRMWNGDWVRDPREDGKGLAAVREAILWAVGFAPQECRGQAVHGLVVMSVETSAGRVRLALGAPAWRWSDLLSSR